ncbi:MAG TPA: EscD/YscD/HrpQ family type III secretion system inner membrane ring protein, partial [Parachlamydiales bacterium]|nr:EscD/YscD/HrpQ family type III secretion system inner membrane ring protein [Parachlamydiales bacterium]
QEKKTEFQPEEALGQAAEEVETTDWKKAKIPPKYLLAASGFALIFFIIFISFFSLFKSDTVEIVQKEPIEEIGNALTAFPAVQFSFNPASGKLFLVGHVSTSIQFQEMHYNMSQIPFITDVEDTVVIDEVLSKTMNDLLSSHANWRSVSISAPQPGQFVVSGYIQTNAEAQNLNDYLLINFPYAEKLTNRVTVEEILNIEVASLMLSKGFASVSFQLNQGSIVLSGLYTEERKKEYAALLKELNTLPGVHAVKNLATPTSHQMARIDLSQQYQVSGSSLFDGRGYSVILNGKVFTRGDFVDGMKITSIESNTILLEKDGLKYTINYAPGH